jgi:hypothetical protein
MGGVRERCFFSAVSLAGEIEIPWILAGPGGAAGKELITPVNTYDTAATVAYIFGLKTPECWIARPVVEAFSTAATATR